MTVVESVKAAVGLDGGVPPREYFQLFWGSSESLGNGLVGIGRERLRLLEAGYMKE